MKNIRIGNNVDITWNIKKILPLSTNLQVFLIDKYNHKQSFDYTIEDNVISGTFYGKDQVHTGAYRMLLVENEGQKEQTVVDYLNAFTLVANISNSTTSGSDAYPICETEVVDITSTIEINKFSDDYAKKSDIPTLVSQLANDVPYLTEHQDLSTYAKKSDIPTKTTQLINDSGYLTEHQDLSDYAKKTDIPTVPTKVSQLANDVPYLTEHQDLSTYAKKSDIPTKTTQLINDSGYLTEHQDLSDYAKKTDIPTVPTKVSQLANDVPYLTEHQSLEGYAKTTYVDSQDTAILNTAKEYADNAVVNKADKSEIPTKVSQLTNDSGYLTEHQDLSDYAKKTDIPTVPTKVSQLANDVPYLTEHQSLEGYAKSAYVDAQDLATLSSAKEYTDNAIVNKADKSEIPTKVSQLTNDKGYLTEHQSLEAYALKTEIPTKVSQLANDKGYITEHQSLEGYAKTTYVDSQDAANLTTAKEYSDTNLTTAKDYTDTSISKLTWSGTQEEYDALETKSANTIYMITEE